jgi:hypothetical protein
MMIYDITLRGSLVGEGHSLAEARLEAQRLSLVSFPNRLVRVHDLDGETIIFEYRNGIAVYEMAA